MWSNYFFYLMGLPENERNVQITILVAFWIFMFGIGIVSRIYKEIVPEKEKPNLILKVCCKKI